jgi:cysteine synthase
MQTKTVLETIGHTPLIEIKTLSKKTGCRIFGKAEYLNPGGSVKDRTALYIIEQAEKQGLLKPGMSIVEGTAGNTGIGLAIVGIQKGYKVTIVMPNNQAQEKFDTLNALGVELIKVPPCPFADQNHFYHTARRISEERSGFYWANQFENVSNMLAHYESTGPEIWEQTEGQVNAFISAVGTGGTLSGVSRFLKSKNQNIHIRLVDPYGSGLFSFFKNSEMKSEGTSITEGIGIMRITENYKNAIIDEAVRITDQEMLDCLYYLARHEGLLVGTSAALNVMAAYKYALENKNSGKIIATMLCDSALRYQSKIFNPEFLKEKGLIGNFEAEI